MIAPFELLILGLLGLIAYRALFVRRDHQVSLLVPILAGLMIVGVLMMGYGSLGKDSRRAKRDRARRTEQRLVVQVPATSDLQAEPGSPIPDPLGTPTESTSVRIEETEHGNMLVMPLPAAILEQHIGPDGVRALESMTRAFPEELNEAYFMVPIPGAVGDAVPGLRALANAITQVAQSSSVPLLPQSATLAEATTETSAPLPSVVRPEWVESPREDQLVVTTEFEESLDMVEKDLHHRVTEALLAGAWHAVSAEEKHRVHDGRQLELTEEAVQSCIRERFRDEVELEMANGRASMYAVSALLEIPDELHSQAVQHVEASLRHQRTLTVGAAAVSLGLVIMLAAGLLQLGRSSGRFARFVGVPLMALMMLPGIAISGRLVQRVVASESADVPSPFALRDTIIDVRSVPAVTSNSELRTSETQYLD